MGKLKWADKLIKKTEKAKAKKEKLEVKAKKAWDKDERKSYERSEKKHKLKQDMVARWDAQDKKAAKKIAEKNKKTLDKVKKMEGVSDETKLAAQREGIKKEPTRHAAGGPVKLTDRQYLKGK
jgi:uncharacterized protein (DUF885 family)